MAIGLKDCKRLPKFKYHIKRIWWWLKHIAFGRIIEVKIGDDVIIAPNAYVNFDVSDHSIVIGNPEKIIHKDNVTKGYILDSV